MRGEPTLRLAEDPVELPMLAELRTWSIDRSELKAAYARDCRVRAIVRFMRAPFVQKGPASTIIGDLRYDRQPELGFSEIALTQPVRQCPQWVPPWVPPRLDALESAR